MASAKALAAAGASAIDAIVTHALFPATERHHIGAGRHRLDPFDL